MLKNKIRINPCIYFLFVVWVLAASFQQKPQENDDRSGDDPWFRDIYADTWVANDALGRSMPVAAEVGGVKTDKKRVVGIFYITWHLPNYFTDCKAPYSGDVTKVLHADPQARFEANNPLWKENTYHWGEPENGYFLSKDEYVIRKDMSMLSDAGVDVLIMDVTNAVRYWDQWEVTFQTMEKMRSEGNKVPKFVFWAFNGPVISVVQDLYDRIYKEEKYKDLWFYWDGKPLLLYNGNPFVDATGNHYNNTNPHYDASAKTDKSNPHYGDPDYTEENYKDYTRDVKDFFTLRTMWWGYYEWAGKRFVGTEDNWSFGYSMADSLIKSMSPVELAAKHDGKIEQFAVTPAQHPVSMTQENMGVGKSWSKQYGEPKLNQYDMPDSAYVPWLGKKVKDPVQYGIYFQERWEEALEADPQFLYLNDWNEWTAGKYPPESGNTRPWLGRQNSFFFVDQYNAEFNRTISPMKGGYTDNYYMQMVQNIRRYKGVRSIPELEGFCKMAVDGDFSDWKKVTVEYRDTKGDVAHRDHNGYGGLHYTNNAGRNDIITAKVAVGRKHVFFYVETSNELTSWDDPNWMFLLVDADNDPETGWYGYDYIINKKVKSDHLTTLMKYDATDAENPWKEIQDIDYHYSGTQMELAIPKKLLGVSGDHITLDFKWCDHPVELKDPISFCTDGDAAPNRRFNYRMIWKK